VFEQPVTASPAEFLHRQRAPAVEGLAGPDDVHAANEAADPLERGWAFQLWRPSCLAVGDRKSEGSAICADLGQRGWQAQQDRLQSGVGIDPLVSSLELSESFDDLAHILFEQAVLAEGGHLEDPAAYVRRVNAMLVG
jgi:hypothetical protein